MIEKNIYVSLDIAKYVMAVLILLGHTANEWAHVSEFWHYALSCNFTVPTFFAISGFLFFSKIESLSLVEQQKEYYKRWSKRVAKMYLVWSIIYFVFVFINWYNSGFEINKIVSYIHRGIVFSTYPTIWFLPALWFGVSIAYFLKKKLGLKKTCSILLLFWIIGVYFGAYFGTIPESGLLKDCYDGYMNVFVTFRNGLFYGSVYSFVGYFVYKYNNKFTLRTSFIYLFITYFLFFIEAIQMKKITSTANVDMAFFMLPSVFFIVIFILHIKIKQRLLYVHLRNQSMLIFCGQRLFLTAIPGVLPITFSEVISSFVPGVVMALFTISVLLFAYFIDKFSVKYPILSNLR